MRSILVLLGGGTGSGKSTIARNISSLMQNDCVTIISLDSYYQDRSNISLEERNALNFDHPDALDWKLLRRDMIELLRGRPVHVPKYSYRTHTRTISTEPTHPSHVLLLEGTLALYDTSLNTKASIRVFADLDKDLRLARRLLRDVNERGRSLESVVRQYLNTVRPMHDKFVEPTRKYAEFIIENGAEEDIAKIVEKLNTLRQSIC